MIPLYIFDLDGTLALCDQRLHHLEDKSEQAYQNFYEACPTDTPNLSVINTLQILLRDYADVRIWTGRSETVRTQTIEWLGDNTGYRNRWGNPASNLVMRPEHNKVPDYLLKEKWLAELKPKDRARLVAVFEDRTRVVDMYRKNGVTCYQVADGEF